MTGSWFNTQMICLQCQKLETEHPLYEKAKKVENEHSLNGNYNFEGIGLPKDLENKSLKNKLDQEFESYVVKNIKETKEQTEVIIDTKYAKNKKYIFTKKEN